MRLIHYLELENFKTFGDRQRIELDHPAVIIGPNNCGKTSVIQALALWGLAIQTWQAARAGGSARDRAGTPLNRLNILNVPVPRTRFFWHETKVRSGNNDVPLIITAGLLFNKQLVPVSMRFRNQGEDLVYCQPDESIRDNAELLEFAAKIRVELLYPMSGLELEEPVLQAGRIGVLLGLGQTAQVLRNLCSMVYRESPADWARIVLLMKRLFQVELGNPEENARGAIDLYYTQPGVKEPLALTSSGRGFQQMLLIFAYLFSHKHSVLMVDEPDAHLEILRQKQVFVLLRDIATENHCQVVLVTHSEVILDEALDTNLTLLLNGRADNLSKKTGIRESLKIYGTAHYVMARQRGYVLYVEGSTDVEILRALARRLEHRAATVWDETPNVFFVKNVHASPTAETELERVEGGFGIEPREHFNKLRQLLPGLKGLAVLDTDGRNRQDYADPGLRILYWRRYEIENYFINPAVLLDFVEGQNPELGLFSIQRQTATELMDELVLERIFETNQEEFAIWAGSPGETRDLIWDAKTQSIKLSAFAEEFFRRLRDRTGLDLLLTKGEFHRLVPFANPRHVPKEVSDKLEAIAGLFAGSGPMTSVPDVNA